MKEIFFVRVNQYVEFFIIVFYGKVYSMKGKYKKFVSWFGYVEFQVLIEYVSRLS